MTKRFIYLSIYLLLNNPFTLRAMDISGLDKKEVLKALYSAAKNPEILDRLKVNDPRFSTLSDDEATKICSKKFIDIDYLNGKSMKINLSGNEVDTFLYNRENGDSAAENAIQSLRIKK